MRSISLILAAAALVIASPAFAVAPPPPPPVYVGLFLGYDAGGADTSVRVTDQDYFSTSSIDSIMHEFPSDLDGNAFTFGGFLGVQMPIGGNATVGLEGDLSWLNLDESKSVMRVYPCCSPDSYTIGESIERNWLATLRARVAFEVTPQLSLYGTGGFAMGDADYKIRFEDDSEPVPLTHGSNSDTLTGWTLGGGLEYALPNGVVVRAEYLYIDLGSINARTDLSGIGANDTLRAQADVTDNIVRIGLRYSF